MQLFDLQFVLDSNLMDSMTEIDHFHATILSCFQVLTPKNKTKIYANLVHFFTGNCVMP